MALLNEVVLFRPVETVLQPWLKRAPNDAVRQWMLTVLRNWLMKSPNDLYKLPYLPVTADEKQKKAYSFSDLYDVRLSPTTEGDLEHIMDFFKNNPDLPRLGRMSVENVHQAADEWVKAMNAKAKKQPDNPKEVKTMIEFPGGYRMVDLIGKTALSKEGGLMHHCVGGGTYWDAVKSGKSKIYSLRDGNNHPCVTIEVDVHDNSTDQIKGHGNQAPVRRYWPMLKAFFQQTGIQVTGDYRNVGLLRIYDGDRWFNITQDQFKDLLLDPQNQEGQKLLSYYQQHGGDYGSGLDLALGIFTSLYGTDRLTDGVIRVVFSQMPIEAVQTVEQFGNRLTQAQINVAFASLPRRQRELPGLYKRLLTATKPTDEEIRTIIQALVDESDADFERAKANNRNGYGPYRHNYNYDVTFVTALAEATPALYRRLVGTPEAVMAELAAKNDRQIGPFYAFVGDPQMPADLAPYVPEMIAKAFRNDPAAAGAHLKAKNFVFNEHTAFAALDGCSQAYWDRENTNLPTLEWLIQVTKPDEKTVNAVFTTIMSAEHNKAEFAKVFLKVLQKEAPEAISQTIHEKALRVIDDKGLIENYLTQQPHPTLEFQNFLFQGKEHLMAWVQNVDPSFFARVLEMLRPSAINPETENYKNVPDRAKRKNPQTSQDTHAIKQIKFKRPKTPEERAAAINAERSKVTNRFLEYLAPLIKEPDHPLCLATNTPIHLVDGRILSLAELIDEHDTGKENWVYSCDPTTGEIMTGPITWAGITRRDAEVVQLTFDNGKDLICTPDHKIPVLGKGDVPAHALHPTDDLIALNNGAGGKRHVATIEPYGRMDVGTLTIDRDEVYHPHHNFAIAADVFVKNSINDDYFLAMCLRLDTRIVLLDGRTLTLTEIIKEHEEGKQNWVYSLNVQTHEFEPGRIAWAGVTRRDAALVRVTLDNGEYIDATPDHRFILRDGSEVQAAVLKSDDTLMPLPIVPFYAAHAFYVQHDRTLPVLIEHTVASVEILTHRSDTGDVTVESPSGSHLFALAAGIYVHNSSDGRGSKVETLPGDSGTNEINQQSAKYKVGKKAFEQLGKGKLFDLATRVLDAKNLHAAIIGGAYKGLDSMNPSLLLQRLDSIPDRDLVKIIDAAGYNADLLPYVINHAPQRMPGIMLAHKYRHNYRAGHVQWGDLKFKNLDKNKTLAALEYVWADPRVPEGMKDDFTLKVFKRFKPPAAKLMQMLRSADDEKATEYVLKKTSKPSEELLMYVADEFPKLLEYAQNIPQPILAHLFASNIQLVVGLMNRDLRGYGKTSRRNWEAPNFHNRIDPSSEIFGRYQAAAKAAGKEAEFNRYVQQAQLDDKVRHRQDFTVKTGTGDERELNYEKVAEHINEFSDDTILQLAQQAKDRKAIVRLCFRYFGAKKLARLANMGLFGASEYNRDYVWVKRNPNDYWGKTERNKFLSTLNTKKVMEMAQILLNTEHVNRTLLEQLFLQLQAEGFEIDNDMLIKLLEKLEGSRNDIEPFLNDSLDATAKDWVADHQPYKMDHIQNPTPHMVTKLFDEFGGIEKREGKYRVKWMFSQIVFKWFSSGDGLWFHYRANPAASRLLIDEAKRRGGLAVSIVASMLKKIGELRQKAANGEKTISTPYDVYLTMVPPGVKTKK